MNPRYEFIYQLKRLYWFIVRPKTQGVKCILVKDGKILMIRKRFGSDKLVFPGGAIDPGESNEATVRREIKEDLGVTLGEVHDLGSFTQDVHHRHETIYVFMSELSEEVADFDTNKLQEIRWFTEDKLPPLTPISKSVMARYRATPYDAA